jgi:hypothetical protein
MPPKISTCISNLIRIELSLTDFGIHNGAWGIVANICKDLSTRIQKKAELNRIMIP